MISLDKVYKSFDDGATFAVEDVSFTVREGETFVLLGSSGCGKSTTLKMINRLVDATKGRVEVDGVDVRDHDPITLRRNVGYVIQRIGLLPHLTIEANVVIVPRLLGWDEERRKKRAAELLELVHLSSAVYGQRYPDELSGGQQQRVGVARALAADPKYLLMDEPFGALDAITRETLQEELKTLREAVRKTIVFVTHDIFEALALADRIAVMHEGKIHQIGTPAELVGRPATDFVDRLFGKPASQLASFRALVDDGAEEAGR